MFALCLFTTNAISFFLDPSTVARIESGPSLSNPPDRKSKNFLVPRRQTSPLPFITSTNYWCRNVLASLKTLCSTTPKIILANNKIIQEVFWTQRPKCQSNQTLFYSFSFIICYIQNNCVFYEKTKVAKNGKKIMLRKKKFGRIW